MIIYRDEDDVCFDSVQERKKFILVKAKSYFGNKNSHLHELLLIRRNDGQPFTDSFLLDMKNHWISLKLKRWGKLELSPHTKGIFDHYDLDELHQEKCTLGFLVDHVSVSRQLEKEEK